MGRSRSAIVIGIGGQAGGWGLMQRESGFPSRCYVPLIDSHEAPFLFLRFCPQILSFIGSVTTWTTIRGQEHVKKSTFGRRGIQAQKNFAIRGSMIDLLHPGIHFQSGNNLRKMGRINFFTCSRRN